MGASKKAKGQPNQSSPELTVVAEPSGFFKERVNSALQNQRVRVDPHTEYYLVDLLSRFMFSENFFTVDDNGNKREEVLALLLQEALTAENISQKQEGLRRLGDVSLYTAGFLSDRLSRKIVDVEYYIGMGRNAYGSLAQTGSAAGWFQKVFIELSEHFDRFVDVLSQVSEQTGQTDPKNILRLYELWVKTRSQRAEQSLKEAGIIPNKLIKPDWQ